MCVCVCVCMCLCVCMYEKAREHKRNAVCVFQCAYPMWRPPCVCLCVYLSVHVCVFLGVCRFLYVYVCVCVHVCKTMLFQLFIQVGAWYAGVECDQRVQ